MKSMPSECKVHLRGTLHGQGHWHDLQRVDHVRNARLECKLMRDVHGSSLMDSSKQGPSNIPNTNTKNNPFLRE
jgi:hypothetical protein